MELLIIAAWIAWPCICYSLAVKKGRNPSMAIFGGIVFGLLSVIYYNLLPDKKV